MTYSRQFVYFLTQKSEPINIYGLIGAILGNKYTIFFYSLRLMLTFATGKQLRNIYAI